MAAAAAPKSVQKGVVKQVMSGDTIVIRGPPRGGPPPERTLSLAGVTAPRLARRPNNAEEPETKDEPWAWFSREQLRKKLVGKEITFVVDYTVPSGREFGTVFLGSENIVKTAVQNGWVKIREGGRNEGEEWEELVRLGSVAQDTKLGVHADDNGKAVRRISWTQENMRAVVDGAKGAPVDAVIEQVRDGSTLRAFLLPSFEYVTIFLTGIKSPSFKKTDKGEEAEEFAAEAKFYVESRLLQRDVKIVLEGVNNQNYLGTVQHPVGNISEFLLGDGLARIADWSIGNVTNNRDKYRAAESAAKAKKLRLWSKYVSSAAAIPLKDKVFTAVVEEIVNVECIIVRAGDVSRKVWLSSIRAPKAKADEGAAEAKKKSMYDIPYAFEAREFLRKKLIGQKVKVEVDYIKPAQDNFPEKTSVTLWADTINIGEALVSKGYATVLRHRQDDDQRSAQYDNLLAAETRAQKNEKGVHNTKDAPLHRVNDLTGKDNKTIAERSLPSLQRAGRVSAVVEYVASGSRLRVYVPKETCLISLVLAGISCPRSAMPQTPAEPFGEEALQATRRAVLQREVEIEIETIDKTGNFVGHVYFEGKNLSVLLLEQGLASLHFSADRYKNANTVAAAERGAKEAKLGLWENYVEPEAAAAPVEQKERKTDYKKVVVTEVTGSTKFWVQNEDAEAQVTTMMQQLQSVASAGSIAPKHGVLCAAKFSDGQWYRAKLLKNGDKFEVLYIDYGNKEPAPLSQLSAIPPAISALAPFAREYTLAYVNPPTADYEEEVTSYFRQLVLNKHFLLNAEYRDGTTEYATLVDGPSKTEAATVLLAAGYLTVKNRREEYLKGLMAEYNKAQSVSKQNRLGMWIYGDITPDDDREFGMRK